MKEKKSLTTATDLFLGFFSLNVTRNSSLMNQGISYSIQMTEQQQE